MSAAYHAEMIDQQWREETRQLQQIIEHQREALQLTERNLSSLIAAKHSDAVLMADWREVVRKALA